VSEIRLAAEVRTEFGKGGARRTRRDGKIPAVIYGHGANPRHVSLPAREFTQAIKQGANVLLTLELDGKDELAIAKAIQRDPIKGSYKHIDLLTVLSGEKVTVDVTIKITGDVAPGGQLAQEANSISVETEATSIPTEIELSIEGLAVGTQLTASDVTLPAGTTLVSDPELLIVNVTSVQAAQLSDPDTEAVVVEGAAIPAE
jgi:large subunit ribosomal protein L25